MAESNVRTNYSAILSVSETRISSLVSERQIHEALHKAFERRAHEVHLGRDNGDNNLAYSLLKRSFTVLGVKVFRDAYGRDREQGLMKFTKSRTADFSWSLTDDGSESEEGSVEEITTKMARLSSVRVMKAN